MKPRESIRYSEAFKLQVIQEIEGGKFRGPNAAARAYGIKGGRTIYNWLRKYGREDSMPRKVTITTMSEQDETKELKKRVRELEKALADAYMKELLGQSFLKIACERLGTPVEEFKKKVVTRPSETAKAKPALE